MEEEAFEVSSGVKERMRELASKDWLAPTTRRAKSPAVQAPVVVPTSVSQPKPAPKRVVRGPLAFEGGNGKRFSKGEDQVMELEAPEEVQQSNILRPLGAQPTQSQEPIAENSDLLVTFSLDLLREILKRPPSDSNSSVELSFKEELRRGQNSVSINLSDGILEIGSKKIPFITSPLQEAELELYQVIPSNSTITKL